MGDFQGMWAHFFFLFCFRADWESSLHGCKKLEQTFEECTNGASSSLSEKRLQFLMRSEIKESLIWFQTSACVTEKSFFVFFFLRFISPSWNTAQSSQTLIKFRCLLSACELHICFFNPKRATGVSKEKKKKSTNKTYVCHILLQPRITPKRNLLKLYPGKSSSSQVWELQPCEGGKSSSRLTGWQIPPSARGSAIEHSCV